MQVWLSTRLPAGVPALSGCICTNFLHCSFHYGCQIKLLQDLKICLLFAKCQNSGKLDSSGTISTTSLCQSDTVGDCKPEAPKGYEC